MRQRKPWSCASAAKARAKEALAVEAEATLGLIARGRTGVRRVGFMGAVKENC